MPEPTDSLNEILGAMADRLGKYAEIWQDAAKRNARNEYNATEAMSDLQKTFTMGLRDAADTGAAMLTALGALAQQPSDEPATRPAKKPAAKKPAANKPAAKRPAAKRPAKRKPTR